MFILFKYYFKQWKHFSYGFSCNYMPVYINIAGNIKWNVDIYLNIILILNQNNCFTT